MSNLINIAAGMLDGGDDLRVIREDYGDIIDVRFHHTDQPAEYLRGMVELICESTGLPLSEGHGKSVIYQAILDRAKDVIVVDI